MPYQTIRVTVEGELALLALNRPEQRNALTPEMIEEICAALDELERGPERVVLLSGEGKSFCAGMDLRALKDLATQTREQNLADARRTAAMFRRLWSYPKPTIAAVQGFAVAGGCGLATVCDFTVAARGAQFGYTEVRVGFMPALVSMFLERQVGEKVARNLLLTGDRFDAAQAQAMGLVTRVVEPSELMAAARGLAASLLQYSAGSIAATKRLLVRSAEAEIDRRISLGIAESVAIRETADFREGLAAFLEKRPPRWPGR